MKNSTVFAFCFFILMSGLPLKSQSISEQAWRTRFEKSGYNETERYAETIGYFRLLTQHSKYAKLMQFGISPQGRKMYYFVVSADRTFTPAEAHKNGKPVVMIDNGIHAGEIEGKDACMLLLRDMLITGGKSALPKNITLIIIPVFNVDGHERFGKFNRINQNGPKEMGWRTTAQNLNLNRDWMKADAPEMQAMLKLFSSWLPDFFVDTHTTDGADYQYDITYAMEKFGNMYKGTADWIRRTFIPYMTKYVNDEGFLVAPYLSFKGDNPETGIVDWAFEPRFSQSYAAAQNRPGLLIETHMLKPYKDRVFSTKAMLTAVIKYADSHPTELVKMNKSADENTIEEFSGGKKFLPLSFKVAEDNIPFDFKGIKFIKDSSSISGSERITYTGEKYETTIPYYNVMKTVDSVTVPHAYIIPKEWENIAGRMKMHGINIYQIKKDETRIVTRYKFKNVKFARSSFEGSQRVDCDYDTFTDTLKIPSGTYIIPTNQRTLRVIVNLLEPKAPDSFLRWGFFNVVFERKEYFESYVMEKLAKTMMSENPSLAEEFERKLKSDEKFRDNPRARLNFFYERSPYFDKEFDLYPVMRIE